MSELNQGTQTAASRYHSLEKDRQIFLMRAREVSTLTLPMLFPPEGHSAATRYPTPYQSLGARGINNIASKLLLALLPPEMSFFRLRPSPKVEAELDAADAQNADPTSADDTSNADKLDAALSTIEQDVIAEIESRSTRIHLFEGIKQLAVGGNTLLYLPKDGIRVYSLEQYVVQRDPSGNLLEVVVKECVAPNVLPNSVREAVLTKLAAEDKEKGDGNEDKSHGDERTVELFTWVQRGKRNWTICQEVKGIQIPESRGTYPIKNCPWLALRWTRISNESYGRGLGEEYLGDLASMEGLSKALVEAAVVAAKCLFLVKPNGTTRPEALNNKPNGSIVEGDPEEIGTMKLDKNADLTFASNLLKEVEQRLSYAFLLNSAIQRNGERVTAEEIRYMANELETSLGGVYSLLAAELQLPLAQVVMAQMQKTGELPPLPEGTVKPSVVTGMDALGRAHELERLDQFTNVPQEMQQVVQTYIVGSDYLSRRAAALGIKSKGLIRTERQIQAAQQAQQQQESINKLGGPAMQAGAKLMQQNMQNQQQQAPDQQDTAPAPQQ